MDQQKIIAKLTTENGALRKQIQANETQITELKNLVKTFQDKLFGTRSEKSTPVSADQLALWEDDDSVFNWSEQTDEKSTEDPQAVVQKSQKRRKKRQAQIAGLDVIKKVKRLEDPTCPYGQELKVVGEKFSGKKLHYKPAKLWVVKEYLATYVCNCRGYLQRKVRRLSLAQTDCRFCSSIV